MTVDASWGELADHLLARRYLLPGENIDDMIRRCTFGNEAYYRMLTDRLLLPNSPTLFNAGTDLGTLSACFKFDIEDTLSSILDVHRKAGLVLQRGGGVGYCFSKLRPEGSAVKSTHGVASGPVGFMRIYQTLASVITQGGKRDGAQMAILHCDHPDIEKFIECKNTPEKADEFSTFNISVAMTDEWMGKLQSGVEENVRQFDKIAEGAWSTGDPGLYFIDHAEKANPTPWLGKLTATNPCGEVPLLNDEPCNLASLVLSRFVRNGEVDWDMLQEYTRLGIQYLDEILDNNVFPHPDITAAALLTRKLGLGVMGWADMLALLHIDYDTEEAVELGHNIMHFINRTAVDESRLLGLRKGIAPCFTDPRSKEHYRRNATVTCIAPTGSISLLAGPVSSGIEPHFALSYYHKTAGLVQFDAVERALSDGFKPKIASEIDPIWHLRHQEAFQSHTELAVSKTINLPNSATKEQIKSIYIQAWEKGCKGVTVFRDGCRSVQVLNTASQSIVSVPSAPIYSNGSRSVRVKLPDERQSITHKFSVGDQEGYLTVGLYPDGRPGEVFLTVNKEGSTIAGLLDTIGIMISMALQHGVELESITKKLRNINFAPDGMTANKDIPFASSIVDYLAHWLEHKFIEGAEQRLTYDSKQLLSIGGGLCPQCGSTTIAQEGCLRCVRCDWSRC